MFLIEKLPKEAENIIEHKSMYLYLFDHFDFQINFVEESTRMGNKNS